MDKAHKSRKVKRRRQQMLREQNVTRLSERDRTLFLAMLEDETTKPNKALLEAARRYKKESR
jgi:uncharacterized protein (DUF1778 family)